MVTVACTQTEDHSVVDGVLNLLKILMFAMNGEKDSFKDNENNNSIIINQWTINSSKVL